MLDILRGPRALFFLFEHIYLAWPDDLRLERVKPGIDSSSSELASFIRTGTEIHAVESVLCAQRAQALVIGNELKLQDIDINLAWLYYYRYDFFSFKDTVESLRSVAPERLEVRVLTIVAMIAFSQFDHLKNAPSGLWSGLNNSSWLKFLKVEELIYFGEFDQADNYLVSHSGDLPLEGILLKSEILAKRGQYDQAISNLRKVIERAPNNIKSYVKLIGYMIDGRQAEEILSLSRRFLGIFGEHRQFLFHVTTLNLFQRHPGLALRSSLMQQVWASVQSAPINFGNQICSYEMNGRTDWLEHLLPSVLSKSLRTDSQMHSNLSMQLASIESKLYPMHMNKIVDEYSRECNLEMYAQPRFPESHDLSSKSSIGADSGLRIGWLTGDLSYHPVGRFMYGALASNASLKHNHCLVSLVDHREESLGSLFSGLKNVDVEKVAAMASGQKLDYIRSLDLDLAIDLSGWTGGHYLAGFMARIAPVQVNYLGYFASVGIPQMDYWLGDNQIFPDNHSEWATERLWRLSRPFLAWEPRDPLPEASLSVTDPPSGSVRFGSFNHNRKLSDDTLRLWGELLNSIPNARLVLKASADSDGNTLLLLQRRMRRQGLDPERVDWLPLTKGPIEHMQQYKKMDIALDPIPNGGCTTTCEALWMGVPTITLAGSQYVSRMSTAVLAGANMPEWIARDRAGYINLAREHSARVTELRANRDHWRRQLQASPLGDATDLMHHLEAAFSDMHAEVVSRF